MKVGQVCVLAVGRRMPLAAEEAEGPGVGDVAGIALPLLICIAVTCADSRPPRRRSSRFCLSALTVCWGRWLRLASRPSRRTGGRLAGVVHEKTTERIRRRSDARTPGRIV